MLRSRCAYPALVACLGLIWPVVAAAQAPASARQAAPGRFDPAVLARIDAVVTEGIADGQTPGAVVVVGDSRGVVHRKAYGQRAVVPSPEPMTVDTIFDAASLTKVIATTTSVMLLVEDGRVRLMDTVAQYIPEFRKYGKGGVTIRHLLTHTSGLRPDLDLTFEWKGDDEAIRLACEEVLVAAPGDRFVYSDINFFLLGEIVKRASGRRLDQFARERIFTPLGMRDTMFLPPESLRARIAPTESCPPLGWPCDGPNQQMLRGIVHDPTSRRMGGVAGHAGLFLTADDLARFARMLLNRGTLGGVRLLAPLTVARMASPSTPAALVNVRGLGWDMDSSFSVNRGDLMAPGSFGHTGWTGTGIWVDPASDLFVLFLSNRVHPDGKGDVAVLRGRVATIAASALRDGPLLPAPAFGGAALVPSAAPPAPAPATAGPVLTGIDVLRADGFKLLAGKRVGLVTNHTGVARDGATTIDLLHKAPGVTLVALFSPEHGIRGTLDEDVPSANDEKTGLPIHSLYGATRRPSAETLRGLDVIVLDLQDIGARIYTYPATMAYVMEEAAKVGVEVVVLDRPNPVNGWQIEGPTLDADEVSFVGHFPAMPLRHGLTMGEMARLFNEEQKLGATLTVVAMRNWSREQWFDQTGLPWINPSPNMRNMLQATLYPGVGSIEYANVSVGRGTDTPFEQIGAPWINGVELARVLNARNLPGISFYPVTFTPTSSKYANEVCHGVFMIVTNRETLRPARLGLELASAIARLHKDRFDPVNTHRLTGAKSQLRRVIAGEDPGVVSASWPTDEAKWRLLRGRYLLY